MPAKYEHKSKATYSLNDKLVFGKPQGASENVKSIVEGQFYTLSNDHLSETMYNDMNEYFVSFNFYV